MIITGGYLYSASFEPDLQKTWKNQGLANKISEKLVLDMQLSDPVSLKSSTIKNMALDRIEKSESGNEEGGQVSMEHSQN